MQTVEIDKEVYENMVSSMSFLHTMVKRLWKLLHPTSNSGKWLTPYAAATALRITPRVLQTLKSNGKIGYFQEPGGNCLINEADIADYLRNNRKEADDIL